MLDAEQTVVVGASGTHLATGKSEHLRKPSVVPHVFPSFSLCFAHDGVEELDLLTVVCHDRGVEGLKLV